MKRYFKDGTRREVPKCKECNSDKEVGLSTYNAGNKQTENYWECYKCNTVVKKAK